MDIQVGDRVTYKYLNTIDKKLITRIILDENEIKDYKNMSVNTDKEFAIEILKIERPKYEVIEVIEEKKELLTEEEKEFLISMIKFYNIDKIVFNDKDIDFYENHKVVNCPDNPARLEFENIERYKFYTLEELGL